MMKKEIAVFGVATLVVAFGVCFSAQATSLKPTAEEIEAMRAERNAVRTEMQEQREGLKENRAELREERKEVQQQRKERNCENIQNRVRTRINRYENKQEQHSNVFGKLVTKGEEISAKFQEKGLNTSALDDSLVTLKEKVKTLVTEHQTFIDELEATEVIACGESEGEFRENLGEARKMSTQIRAQLVEIREYYQVVVRDEILKLRAQLISTDSNEEN